MGLLGSVPGIGPALDKVGDVYDGKKDDQDSWSNMLNQMPQFMGQGGGSSGGIPPEVAQIASAAAL